MNTKYYLPISSSSLAHYFGGACVLPSKYLPNKPNDTQNIVENSLLLSNFIGVKGSDCCLELILTQQEESELTDFSKGIFLLQKPLPISRVKSIIFANKNQKEQTITNIELSTAFIPKELVRIYDDNKSFDLSTLKLHDSNNEKNWSQNIDQFNRLLGGFALMRLGGEEYMNYSENYFSTLSFFNTVIGDELKVAEKQIHPIYHDAFIGKGSFLTIYKYLYKKISENDLTEIATLEKQQISKDKITGIVNLSKLDRATYIVAVLNTYGTGQEAKKKKVDGLILSNFKSEVSLDKSEVISLCYGLNRGYSVLNNVYKYGSKNKIVKFKLDNQLDYYIIESLYQFSFNKIKSSAFPFLDSWCPKSSNMDINKKNSYQVLDIKVIEKKKPQVNSQAYLLNLLHKYFQKETANMLSGFIYEIRNKIYSDTLEELQETFDSKDAEMEQLKEENNDIKNNLKKMQEPKIEHSTSVYENNINKVEIALNLKKITLKEFKKIADTHNIKLGNEYKDKEDRDKYIIQIMKETIN